VSIARTLRRGPERTDLCSALGIDSTGCETFKYLNWDRPNDIRHVLDDLTVRNQHGALREWIDLNRTLRSFGDPRPTASLAFSPQGPTSEGFFDSDFLKPDTSWDRIDRPVLIATGDGDGSCDPPARRVPIAIRKPIGRRVRFR
jgi:hypothetical protein